MGEPSLLEQQTLVETPWLRVRQQRFEVAGSVKSYTVVDRQDAVVVVPLTPSGHTVVVQQYRLPTARLSWELPMGGIDEGESPIEAGRRELAEETGLTGDRVLVLSRWFPVPGLTAQQATALVIGVADEAIGAAVAAPNTDDIQARRIVPLADLLAEAQSGAVTDGFTLAALLQVALRGTQRLLDQLSGKEEPR